jgi:polar amino acid transport system substrate-binding protein
MRILAYLLVMAVFGGRVVAATEVTAYTEEFPPYNFTRDGKPTGIAVELLRGMCAEAGLICHVRVVPWARGFYEARRTPNSLIFSAARTPYRDSSFVWIGPISKKRVTLFVRSDSPLVAKSIGDVKDLRIGVVNGDSAIEELTHAGIGPVQFDPGPRVETNVLKLLGGHIDAYVVMDEVMIWTLQSLGKPPDAVRTLISFPSDADLYFAVNPGSDPAMIAALQAAWAKVAASPLPGQLVRKYLPGWSQPN